MREAKDRVSDDWLNREIARCEHRTTWDEWSSNVYLSLCELKETRRAHNEETEEAERWGTEWLKDLNMLAQQPNYVMPTRLRLLLQRIGQKGHFSSLIVVCERLAAGDEDMRLQIMGYRGFGWASLDELKRAYTNWLRRKGAMR